MNDVFLIGAASVASSVPPLGAGLWAGRRLAPEFKVLTLFLLVVATVEVSTFWLALKGQNSHWLHHLYGPVGYGLLAYILSRWQPGRLPRRLLLISIPAYAALCLFELARRPGLDSLNAATQTLANVILAMASLWAIIGLLRQDGGTLVRDCRFWVLSAVLLYSAGGLAYFALHEAVIYGILIIPWYFYIGVNIVTNLIYTAAIICQYRQR